MVKTLLQFVVAVAAALAAPALAKPSEAELAAVREAEARGAEMYAYDQAAWHSTDALKSDLRRNRRSLDDLRKLGFKGFVVEPGGEGLLLATYYAEKDGKTWALARYWVARSEVKRGGLVTESEDAALSPLALQLVAIRAKSFDAGLDAKYSLCSSSPVNTIVLPPRADGTISAYILTSTVTHGVYPAGGHFRFDFGPNGEVLSHRRFTNGCVPINTNTQGGNTPVAGFITHLLDPQPTEIHVFVSYNIPVGLFVGTVGNNAMWEVTKGKVHFTRNLPKN